MSMSIEVSAYWLKYSLSQNTIIQTVFTKEYTVTYTPTNYLHYRLKL